MSLSFEEICQSLRVTPRERDALAWHLAMFRAKKTYEKLRKAEEHHTDDR